MTHDYYILNDDSLQTKILLNIMDRLSVLKDIFSSSSIANTLCKSSGNSEHRNHPWLQSSVEQFQKECNDIEKGLVTVDHIQSLVIPQDNILPRLTKDKLDMWNGTIKRHRDSLSSITKMIRAVENIINDGVQKSAQLQEYCQKWTTLPVSELNDDNLEAFRLTQKGEHTIIALQASSLWNRIMKSSHDSPPTFEELKTKILPEAIGHYKEVAEQIISGDIKMSEFVNLWRGCDPEKEMKAMNMLGINTKKTVRCFI